MWYVILLYSCCVLRCDVMACTVWAGPGCFFALCCLQHSICYSHLILPAICETRGCADGEMAAHAVLCRSDIVVREKCTPPQLAALAELDRLLASPSLVLTTLLPTGSLLLLDNTRWFHGRSAILDKQRWLKRVRFNASSEGLERTGQQLHQKQKPELELYEQRKEDEETPPLLHRLVTRTRSLEQQQEEEEGGPRSSNDSLFSELGRQQQQQSRGGASAESEFSA